MQQGTMLYIVIGESGMYSDRCEWMVGAYFDEAEADEHARRANDAVAGWLKVELHRKERCFTSHKPFPLDTVRGLSVYDADSQRYRVQAVPLMSEVRW